MGVLLYGAGAAAVTRFEAAIVICIDANAERDLHAQADKYPAEKCAKKRCLGRNDAKFVEDSQRRLRNEGTAGLISARGPLMPMRSLR